MNNKPNEFDEKAKAWDDNPEHAQRTRAVADAIVKELPLNPKFTAMEYGCGTGLLSFPLKDRFSHITLVDSSAGMLEVLKEKIKRSKSENMEVLNRDLLESTAGITSSFSVIYTSMVLHHIEDTLKILEIFNALLDSPGYLCIADLDSDGGLFHGKEFKGHSGFDREDLKKNAEAAGFTNVSFRTVFEIKKPGNDGVERSFPVFLMLCRKE